MNYGLNLCSIRDAIAENLDTAMDLVAELGYENVEPFGAEFAELTLAEAERVGAAFKARGLRVSYMHAQIPVFTDHLEAAAEVVKALGCNRLILALTRPETLAEAEEMVKNIEQWRVRLEKLGVEMGYHNHALEFKTLEDGRNMMQMLMENTGVFFQLDTYWVYSAEEDPIAWMRRLHECGRLPVIHIKDGFVGSIVKPLSRGAAPWQDVWACARELGVDIVVESETQDPSGPEEITICMEALKSLEK